MVNINNIKKGTVEIRCDYFDCKQAIEESVYSSQISPDDIFDMRIVRYRRYEDSHYTDQTIIVDSVAINMPNDLNKTFTDFTAMPGVQYKYRVHYHFYLDGEVNTISKWANDWVEVKYRGVLLLDETGGYSVLISPNYTLKKTYNVSYVKPYYSKYPHAIQNGNMNYYSGTFTGVYNPIDEQCRLIRQKIIDGKNYELQVMEFLANGRPKILKTYDGNIWYVMIDSQITKEKNGANLMQISFNWTQIGEVPSWLVSKQGEW